MKWLTKIFSNDPLKIGDWVNSYSKGIYRIDKIAENYYDESDLAIIGNHQIDDPSDRTIVSKRLLDSKFKKSISYESCSEVFVSKINADQTQKLKEVLDENPDILKDLDQFEIPQLQEVYNAQLQIDHQEDINSVLRLIAFIETGKTFFEIENEMKQLDIERLKPQHFGNYNFQLINYDCEYRNRKKIWRKAVLTKK